MTSKKNAKKALFSSVLSLLLCAPMLVGTTFAWFTDEVSSGVNTIQSGTLKIGVKYTQDGTTWNDLDSATDLFSGALWEPGHTRVVALKLTNEGSLALKYKVGMNIVSEKAGTNVNGDSFKLSDYLEVSTLNQQANDSMGIGEITLSLAFQGENSVGYEDTNKLSEVSREADLFVGDSHYLIIKVDMPASVGNEANAQPGKEASIQFGISIVAGQAAFENDSFGNQYDKDAAYGTPAVTVKTFDELKNAMTAGGTVKLGGDIVLDEKITVPAGSDVVLDMNGKKLTLKDVNVDPAITTKYGSTLTITGNGTFDLENNYFASFISPKGDVTIENGTFLRGKGGSNYGSFFVGINGGKGKLVINGGYFDGGYYEEDDYFNNCRNLLNCSWGQNIKVYGGTFVGQNPAWGDEGMAHTISTTSTYCQGTFLEGQLWTDTEIPAAFSITEGTTADGRPTYTVNYNP